MPENAVYAQVSRTVDAILARRPDIELGYMDEADVMSAQARRPGARNSLAIEGMVLTADEEALFELFDERRYDHETRGRLIGAYLDHIEAQE